MAPGPRPRPLAPGGSSVLPPAAAGRELCGRATAAVPGVQRRGGRAGGSPARGRPSPGGDAPLGDLGAAGPGARSLQQADLQPPEPAGPHPDRGHARLTWPAAAAGAGPGAAPAAAKPGRREAPAGEELGLGASESAGGRLCFHSAEPPTLRHHGNRSGPVAQWGPLGTQVPGLTRPLPPLGPPLSSLGALRGQAPSRATTATNTPLSQSLSPNHLSRPSKRGRGTREELPKANSYFHPCRQPLPRPLLSHTGHSESPPAHLSSMELNP